MSKPLTHNRLSALIAILSMPESSTIHQVANTLGVTVEQLQAEPQNCTDLTSPYSMGWFTVRTCSREHAMMTVFPGFKGEPNFWIGAANGYLSTIRQAQGDSLEIIENSPAPAPFSPPSAFLQYNLENLSIERNRISSTQGTVKLSYLGIDMGEHHDDVTMKDGTWQGKPDSHWQSFAGKLFHFGKRDNNIKAIKQIIKDGIGITMEPRYYDVKQTIAEVEDSPVATAYLLGIINHSCPDTFHWTEYTEAHRLRMQYGDQPIESLTRDETRKLSFLAVDELDEGHCITMN
jgi:hypothetical protein